VVDARPEPLWSCLEMLAARETQQIVDVVIVEPESGTRAVASAAGNEATVHLKEMGT